MTFLDYLALIRRHWIIGIIITALVTASSVLLVTLKNNQPYETTIFLSIGNQQEQSNTTQSIYDDVQAADAFSQTVQGWFKNPQFIEQINAASGIKADISSRQQEKQNVLITYNTTTEDQANTLEKTIQDKLTAEIATYNSKTNDKFALAIFEAITQKKPLSMILFLIIGLFGGLVIASFALYGFEYLFQKASSTNQISEILEKTALDKFKNDHPNADKLTYISAIINKKEGKNIELITLGGDGSKIAKTLTELIPNKKIATINFPQESDKILTSNSCVVLCTLGKTTTNDLLKLKSLLSNSFDLIIIES